MPFGLKLGFRSALIWNTWSEAGMRPADIVVRHPGFEGLPDVRFVERNHKVETFSTSTAD